MLKKVGEIERGKVFELGGVEWIVLEHNHFTQTTLALSKNIIERVAFDKGNCTNYATSSIRRRLLEVFKISLRVRDEIFTPYCLNLRADNGTYFDEKSVSDEVFLITDEIYRANKDIIKAVDGWWWTATAVSACEPDSDSVRVVHIEGSIGRGSAIFDEGGLRPACNIKSNVLVYVRGGEDEGDKVIESYKAGVITREMFEENPPFETVTESQFKFAMLYVLRVLTDIERENRKDG